MILIDSGLLKKSQEEVTRLNGEIKKLHAVCDDLRKQNDKLRVAHDYYMMLQDSAMADETIMDAFQNLMVLIRLSQEDDVPGLTIAR